MQCGSFLNYENMSYYRAQATMFARVTVNDSTLVLVKLAKNR